MNCLYTVPDVANLSFGPYVPIAEQKEVFENSVTSSSAEPTSDELQDNADRAEETDPLLALAGTVKWDNIDDPDTVLPPEIRVVKGAHEDNPDPLLALAGTLQSGVSDLAERHDEYIAADLLAELRGDVDE